MTPEEFLEHAAECQAMSKFSRDNASKLEWQQMAERWVTCAELAKQRSRCTPRREKKYVNLGTCAIYSQ
jgi:hypothetical protein